MSLEANPVDVHRATDAVLARRFAATPIRTAAETWNTITNLVAKEGSDVRKELESVRGVMASLIADEAPKDAAIVIAGNGPRLRIYCLYGSDAIDGDDRDETALSWVPTEGEWTMHVPCDGDDLEWVKAALKKASSRILAYDLKENSPSTAENAADTSEQLSINAEVFKRL
jgi:hypothetical protein